mgnify:CR=1 FL=1|tara:strand:+ start:137 stop:706 length:570 start_codon:yes stop_codon:yes gene_type:complete
MQIPTFIESYQTEHYELCDEIIKRLENYLDNRSGVPIMTGKDTNNGQSNRLDFSVNFEAVGDSTCAEVHRNILNPYVQKYCDKYTGYAQKPCLSKSMKVQKTPPKGGFHQWHSEHGTIENSAYRTLTWTLYLNDIPNGEGETEFLEYGIKVQPKKGLLSFFPASWTHIHRGNPVYSCDKYIATGWYYLT